MDLLKMIKPCEIFFRIFETQNRVIYNHFYQNFVDVFPYLEEQVQCSSIFLEAYFLYFSKLDNKITFV